MNTPTLTVADDGSQEWWINGLRHREDGPAVIFKSGTQMWFLNNRYHRTDGPAVIWSDGTQSWWINGRLYTDKKKYQKDAKLSDKDMTMLLLKYTFN